MKSSRQSKPQEVRHVHRQLQAGAGSGHWQPPGKIRVQAADRWTHARTAAAQHDRSFCLVGRWVGGSCIVSLRREFLVDQWCRSFDLCLGSREAQARGFPRDSPQIHSDPKKWRKLLQGIQFVHFTLTGLFLGTSTCGGIYLTTKRASGRLSLRTVSWPHLEVLSSQRPELGVGLGLGRESHRSGRVSALFHRRWFSFQMILCF